MGNTCTTAQDAEFICLLKKLTEEQRKEYLEHLRQEIMKLTDEQIEYVMTRMEEIKGN